MIFIALLTGLLCGAAAATRTFCSRYQIGAHGFPPIHLANKYKIRLEDPEGGIIDVGKTCHDLWHYLRKFPAACIVSRPKCEGRDNNRELYWRFTVPIFCNRGMVNSAWWEATGKGKYGDLDCITVHYLIP